MVIVVVLVILVVVVALVVMVILVVVAVVVILVAAVVMTTLSLTVQCTEIWQELSTCVMQHCLSLCLDGYECVALNHTITLAKKVQVCWI